MKVGYKGPKLGGMGILLPVGVRNMSAVKGQLLITKQGTEMSDEDARTLVKIDPHNFELVVEAPAVPKESAPVAKPAPKAAAKAAPKAEKVG